MLMLLVAWYGSYVLFRRGSLPRWMLNVTLAMTFSGWVASLAGWYVTEIGRQPYLVSGVLKTADAVTTIAPGHVGLSLAMYGVLYVFLMTAYIRTLLVMCRRAIEVEEYELALPPINQPQTAASDSSANTGANTDESTNNRKGAKHA